jgi:hypothetical protein
MIGPKVQGFLLQPTMAAPAAFKDTLKSPDAFDLTAPFKPR